MKELTRRDAGFDCDAVVHGQTEDDVLAQAGRTPGRRTASRSRRRWPGEIRTLVHDA